MGVEHSEVANIRGFTVLHINNCKTTQCVLNFFNIISTQGRNQRGGRGGRAPPRKNLGPP